MLKAGGLAGPEALQKAFGDRVVAIGRVLPMLEPWDDPGYVKRAWCLFELYTAITMRSDVEIDIILSPRQAQSFRDRINRDGTDAHAIDGALAHVKSEDAEASVQADLEAIHELIKGYSGGFGTLNGTVKQYLRRWFVSQGGVKVVNRHGAAVNQGTHATARTSSSWGERVRLKTSFPGVHIPKTSLTGFDFPGSVSEAAEGNEEAVRGDVSQSGVKVVARVDQPAANNSKRARSRKVGPAPYTLTQGPS